MGGERERSNSSGEEDDGDGEWRRAINSVAAATSSYILNGSAAAAAKQHPIPQPQDSRHPSKPKHYQLKIQKLLDDMLEKSLEMVKYDDIDNENDINVSHFDPLTNDGGEIRLFKHSTPGILLDPIVEPQQPRKRPKILPGEEINEKSKKFKRRLQSVSIDSETIMASAKIASQKSLERLEAKDLAAKETAKREEERVSELKRVRGEKWLPSIARNRF